MKNSGRTETAFHTMFILDECAQLPKLRHLPRALSLLPCSNTGFVIGCQSIEQISIQYREEAKNMLDLFQTIICLPAASASVPYIQQRFGEVRVMRMYPGADGRTVAEEKEEQAVQSYELLQLETGEAFVQLANGKSFFYRFDRYDS